MSQLASCERDIQTIFMEVVKHFDCSVIEGHRTAERQNFHWAKGRHLKREGLDVQKRSNWIVADPDKIVTQKDGFEKLSRHQGSPSKAVDIVPYPDMWKSKDTLLELRGVVKYVQEKLMSEGKIDAMVDNGGDLWHGFDLPHYQSKDL